MKRLISYALILFVSSVHAEEIEDEVAPPPCFQVDLDQKKSKERDWIEASVAPHFKNILSSKNKKIPKGVSEFEYKYRRVCQVFKGDLDLVLVTYSNRVGGTCRPAAGVSYFAQLFSFDEEKKTIIPLSVPKVFPESERLWNAKFSPRSTCSSHALVEFNSCDECDDSTVYLAELHYEMKDGKKRWIVKSKLKNR